MTDDSPAVAKLRRMARMYRADPSTREVADVLDEVLQALAARKPRGGMTCFRCGGVITETPIAERCRWHGGPTDA